MLRSMTAYARAACESDWGQAAWELRGVNNRYLDIVLRLPEELRPLENRFRELVSRRVKRGKLECNLKLSLAAREASEPNIDLALARNLANAAQLLSTVAPQSQPLRLGDLLRWPGVVRQDTADVDHLEAPITDLLDGALDDLIATREREGARVVELTLARCDEIEAIVERVRCRLPEIVENARTRLHDRLAEVMDQLDEDRVEQEIVIYTTKMDVAEEMDRLDAHITEVRRTVKQAQPVGRRLDFLMQELNREANTLGSKSTDTQTTRASVDLKVLIEQIREQIQNVE